MQGDSFESICEKTLKAAGFRHVRRTKKTRDQGADLLASKKGIRYVIQCKDYERPVGNKAVQEAHAAKTFYDCDAAMVMASTRFTADAQELAEKTGVLLWGNVGRREGSNLRLLLLLLCVGLLSLGAGFLAAHPKITGEEWTQALRALSLSGGVALGAVLLLCLLRWAGRRRGK